MAEMPRYRSHKEVQAARIASITSDNTGGVLQFIDRKLTPVSVSHGYMEKHRPTVGGYYVRYSDGYESWSPAEAFESGNTLIG